MLRYWIWLAVAQNTEIELKVSELAQFISSVEEDLSLVVLRDLLGSREGQNALLGVASFDVCSKNGRDYIDFDEMSCKRKKPTKKKLNVYVDM